ncbi:MAG: hypothetical protein FJX53_00750 [Alphaproteobacteria bacterium]|nr:hypothetical protein [Alphaproteobacteria bacterium]
MSVMSLLVVAVALSADAFAAAIGRGVTAVSPAAGAALAAGVAFGGFQAAIPVAGALLGEGVGPWVAPVDHWIAFAILAGLGLHMIVPCGGHRPARLAGPLGLLLVAFATSIDAFAAGFGTALLDRPGWPLAAAAGVVTFALSSVGLRIGAALGESWGRRAEIVGGLMLAAVGASILVDHLSA